MLLQRFRRISIPHDEAWAPVELDRVLRLARTVAFGIGGGELAECECVCKGQPAHFTGAHFCRENVSSVYRSRESAQERRCDFEERRVSVERDLWSQCGSIHLDTKEATWLVSSKALPMNSSRR
jgi:hypothetical protein